MAGLWEFPGGKQEIGETIQQCIMREIKEELCVECEVNEFLLDVTKEYAHGEFKLMVYKAKITDIENLKAMVHQDLRWVMVKELGDYEFPPADVEIIEYLVHNF